MSSGMIGEVFSAIFDDHDDTDAVVYDDMKDVGDDTDNDVDVGDGNDVEPPYVHEQWPDGEVCRRPYLSCAPALLVQPGV